MELKFSRNIFTCLGSKMSAGLNRMALSPDPAMLNPNTHTHTHSTIKQSLLFFFLNEFVRYIYLQYLPTTCTKYMSSIQFAVSVRLPFSTHGYRVPCNLNKACFDDFNGNHFLVNSTANNCGQVPSSMSTLYQTSTSSSFLV